MAFKDVGRRSCLGGILTVIKKTAKNTVLVATSGDTGGAASGFLGVKGVEVIIPYPSGKVSGHCERQLTTLGQNIKALEVDAMHV
jgi:threonine synthase